MIPPFDDTGNLPPGIHWATWEELADRFSTNDHRQMLTGGLRKALKALKRASCKVVYVDGSFVSNKAMPHDYDACWELEGVDLMVIDPILLEFDNTIIQKAKYRGELFPEDSGEVDADFSFLQFFQTDKYTLLPKGIIAIDLRGLSDD